MGGGGMRRRPVRHGRGSKGTVGVGGRGGKVTLRMSGLRLAASVVLRHMRSTVAKRLPSSGSCCMMSSLLKMGSRYIHWRCRVIHWSRISLTCRGKGGGGP